MRYPLSRRTPGRPPVTQRRRDGLGAPAESHGLPGDPSQHAGHAVRYADEKGVIHRSHRADRERRLGGHQLPELYRPLRDARRPGRRRDQDRGRLGRAGQRQARGESPAMPIERPCSDWRRSLDRLRGDDPGASTIARTRRRPSRPRSAPGRSSTTPRSSPARSSRPWPPSDPESRCRRAIGCSPAWT